MGHGLAFKWGNHVVVQEIGKVDGIPTVVHPATTYREQFRSSTMGGEFADKCSAGYEQRK